MRQALRKALINLGFFGERIYEMQVPSKDTEKPFCVVRFLADTVDNEWLGYRRTVEIYPYLPRTSFLSVDETVKAIIQGLDRQLITDIETGEVFTCLYRSSGQDFVDDEWDAITRVLTFDILALRYVEQVESYSDEWISDIIQALNENLSGWTFYSGYLPQGYNTPCMLLRVRSSNIIRLGHSISKELKTIKIHVLAGTTTERQDGITSLVYLFRIGDKVKIGNNFYIVDKFISVNEANPYSEGQITVDLSKITIEKEEGTKINAVNKRGGIV